ncbi:hypothetical protein AB835_02100 [Candidatus Endobugula sertula]|uniref:Uncharacterized protein n=1 Tax=Candidatus Endobugula sertula TaxID=62101 RepID=A0A1D2QSX5_9GAMM|nr:hypothetical protein AB835_02100 [Candidatus Endobugula sertula]
MQTMTDTTFIPLFPYLQSTGIPTLWMADESALDVLSHLEYIQQTLHIVSNRYDIYQLALDKGFSAEFNDFYFSELPWAPQRIVYRVSKEKALTHHLLNQAGGLLNHYGELLISGKKQEGIKSYAQTLVDTLGAQGKLKKNKNNYFGVFTNLSTQQSLGNAYHEIRKISVGEHTIPSFFSKPGVFGWNKVDTGTQLLLESLPLILAESQSSTHSILDLGCGYGWVTLNLPYYLPSDSHWQITATDNNAAALSCIKKNTEMYHMNVDIIAADCAATIVQHFDLIICNPPFHQGFSQNKALTEKFLYQTNKHLKKTGLAIFVVNEFIKLSVKKFDHLKNYQEWNKKNGFKVISMSAKAKK